MYARRGLNTLKFERVSDNQETVQYMPSGRQFIGENKNEKKKKRKESPEERKEEERGTFIHCPLVRSTKTAPVQRDLFTVSKKSSIPPPEGFDVDWEENFAAFIMTLKHLTSRTRLHRCN